MRELIQLVEEVMTAEEHQQRHKELHRALDELLACYISENPKGSIYDRIYDLVRWSHAKTLAPSSADHGQQVSAAVSGPTG